MMDSRPPFQTLQYGFAAYIRNPALHPVPVGVATERMAMYRELFFNNIENFLATGFPVLKSLLEPEQWLPLVQDFFATHRNHTPLFIGIPEEFLDYLARERGTQADDPPFLQELAHYEWVELALDVAQQEPPAFHPAAQENPGSRIVHLSPLAWPLVYRFPVHKIGPHHQPQEPPAVPTCLLVYRNRDDQVKFMEINPVTYRLLELLETGEPRPLTDTLQQIASELGQTDPAAIIQFGCELARDWAERGIVGLE